MADPATRRATMIDVARLAQVSLKTVSRVINGVETVDPTMAARVMSAVTQLGFRRNDIAASLRSGSATPTIGLIIGDVTNSFYSTILASVAQVAAQHNTLVISASAEEDLTTERRLVIDLCQRRVQGLIIVPSAGDHAYLDAEMRLGTPMVFIDRPPVGVDADVFLIDNRAAARDAADLLLSEGHSRIGIILDSLEIFTMRERLAGVEQAYQSAGLELDATLVTAQAHDPESTARAVRAMLDAPAGPTAFLAGNNRATVGIIEELFSAGRFARVVGFDDFETSHLMPRRTTIVDYDLAGLARDAATTLFRRIGGAVDAPEYHYTPTQLVERGLEQ